LKYYLRTKFSPILRGQTRTNEVPDPFIDLNETDPLVVVPSRKVTNMSKIVHDYSGERLMADSRNDSAEDEKDKRKLIAKGGV